MLLGFYSFLIPYFRKRFFVAWWASRIQVAYILMSYTIWLGHKQKWDFKLINSFLSITNRSLMKRNLEHVQISEQVLTLLSNGAQLLSYCLLTTHIRSNITQMHFFLLWGRSFIWWSAFHLAVNPITYFIPISWYKLALVQAQSSVYSVSSETFQRQLESFHWLQLVFKGAWYQRRNMTCEQRGELLPLQSVK